MSPAEGSASQSGRRVAVLSGGSSLERKVSLRSGAHAQDALRRLGYDTVAIDPGAELVAQLRDAAPDAAFVALHGGEGEDGTVQELLEAIELPYTGSGPAACMRCTDKALAKYLMREAGIPTPDFRVFRETAVKGLGAGAALASVEAALSFPLVAQAGGRRLRAGDQVRALGRGAAGRDGRGVLLRPQDPDRALCRPDATWRSRCSTATDASESDGRALALPVVEAIPREEAFYNYESRYEIGMTTFVCPAELDAQTTARAQELAVQVYRLLGCHGVARVDLMLDEQTRRADGAGGERGPGADRNQPAAAGRRRRWHRLRGAGRAILASASDAPLRRVRPAPRSRPRRSPRGRPGRGTP